MQVFTFEYTDTFDGDANYCWVKRGVVSVPELTHYGYDGSSNYARANAAQSREIVRKVKAELGLTGIRGERSDYGDMTRIDFKSLGTVVFIQFEESLNVE